MTKKRKRYPNLDQKLDRPWCYYCERDFDDLKILISHQKAKHFKCERCNRRLNTAGGLSVHMNQVHKEALNHVENANPGRQGLDVEIFGMEGVPEDILNQHYQQVTNKHFEEEAERARVTGNPIRGTYVNGNAQPSKRKKVTEEIEDIEKRAEKWREDKANGIIPGANVHQEPAVEAPAVVPSPAALNPFGVPVTQTPPFAPGLQQFPPPGAPPFVPPGFPMGMPPFAPPPGYVPGGSPPTVGVPGAPTLPQRPPFSTYPPPPPGLNGAPPLAISASVDELISNAAAASAQEAPVEKKSKKDKNIKLIYFDDIISPEEKMAKLPQYAASVRT